MFGPFLFESRGLACRRGAALLAAAVAIATAAPLWSAGEERAVPARLASASLLLDVAAREGLIVAVGERGHVLLSRDRGASWTQAEVPTRALLTAVHMHDDRLGWAVGHDEVVLRTRDGGVTWERVHAAPENERPLLDVWFADANTGLAIGAYGTVLATTDGGTTWEARTLHGEDDFHLNHITKAPDGALYVAAEAGHLYRSDDAGTTWQALPSPYQGSMFGVLPLADGTVLAFGLRGHLFRSADKGATWEAVPTSTESTLMAALELGPGRWVVAGTAGTLLWSEDGGRTVREQVLPDRKAIVALARVEHRLLAFGESGVHSVEIAR